MKRLSILLTLLAFAVIGLRAQQRPLLTDDVDITPAGALDLAIGIDFFQDAKFPLSGIKGDLTRVADTRVRTRACRRWRAHRHRGPTQSGVDGQRRARGAAGQRRARRPPRNDGDARAA